MSDPVGELYGDALWFAANCAIDMANKMRNGELPTESGPHALMILAGMFRRLSNDARIRPEKPE